MKKQGKDIGIKNNKCVLYCHKRKSDGEIFYIGISTNYKRPYTKRDRSDIWNKYTSKYEYEVEILYENITWKEACNIEKKLISLYGRRDLGSGRLLNMTDGGEGSVNNKNHWSTNPQTKQIVCLKISKANKGKQSYFKGKKHTEESKQKNRDKHIGKSPANKGKESPYKGISRPKHSILMRGSSNSNSKKVHDLETNIIYDTVQTYIKKSGIKNHYQLNKLINLNKIKVFK